MSNLRYENEDRWSVCRLGYLHHSENLNWAAQNLRLRRMRPVGEI